jgi:hypothetical protein
LEGCPKGGVESSQTPMSYLPRPTGERDWGEEEYNNKFHIIFSYYQKIIEIIRNIEFFVVIW